MPDPLWVFFVVCVVGAVEGLVIAVQWKDGPSYYPAGRCLGMAAGVPGAYYAYLVWVYQGDVERAVRQAFFTGSSVYVYMWVVALESVALFLVLRQNHAKAGSSLDYFGRVGKPSQAAIRYAVAILLRADRHGMLGNMTLPIVLEQQLEKKRLGIKSLRSLAAARDFLIANPDWQIPTSDQVVEASDIGVEDVLGGEDGC